MSRGSVIRSVSEESGGRCWYEIPAQFCLLRLQVIAMATSVISACLLPHPRRLPENFAEMKAVIHSRGLSAAAAQRTWLRD